MQRLVLWDIDGTLLQGGGGGQAYLDALDAVFGSTPLLADYSFAGRTDPEIAYDLLGSAGRSAAEIEAGLDALWTDYLDRLRERLGRTPPKTLPGVQGLVDRMATSSDQIVLGLLTGNVEDAARLKLQAAGLPWDRFVVGAFGSDHRNRPELPAVAVRRAEQRTGRRFSGKQIVVIGDTPLDVACGARLGVRTIAVATGSYDVAALRATGADHVFADLSDGDAVLRAVLGDG